ncbi:MAG: nucleoside deaminase [Clostridia bacterium]|nr:nucleoside deaminase [Clostridia bacterium]
MNNIDFMNEAIKQAQIAYKKDEVPIGAVIVHNNKIIAKAYNNREHTQQATNHAEIIAIKKACRKLHSWRLNDCEMYVTLEPCAMCAGAILNARLKSVHIACLDETHGAVNSKYNLLSDGTLNHKTEVLVGEHENDAKNLVKLFFKNLRKK